MESVLYVICITIYIINIIQSFQMINKCHTVLSFFLIKRIQIYFCQFIINIINLDTYLTADGNKK